MLSVYNLNTEEDRGKYRELYALQNRREPHFLLDYIITFASGTENLICFDFVSDIGKRILMPGYLRPVVFGESVTNYSDFITPYGYSGPLFPADISAVEIEQFWKEVDAWYLANNVVTEFVRFTLSDNHKYYTGQVFATMLNIKGVIIEEHLQWTAFDRKVRKNVNKAQREELTAEVYYQNISEQKIAEFYDIYIETMRRTNAADHFFYSSKQFTDFIDGNKDFAAICTVYYNDIAVASELLLVSDEAIYSFLGGTVDSYFEKRPNDFLKVEALNWARARGLKYYILGGGYGYEDGIFKYKKAFFPNDVVSYFTGRKIINQASYNVLVERASELRAASGLEVLQQEDDSFFPLYRKLS